MLAAGALVKSGLQRLSRRKAQITHSKYKRGTEPLADTTPDLGPFEGGRAFNLSIEERDFTNQACAELVWLTTRSITSFMSRACSCSGQLIELLDRAEKRGRRRGSQAVESSWVGAVALVVEDAVSSLRCSPAPPSAH